MTNFFSKSKWYWLTIFLTAIATISIFTISENNLTFVYLRYLLSIILIMFLPGFAFLRVLLLTQSAMTKNIDRLEQIVLSIGLSVALSSLVALLLNYTPFGVRLLPVTFSLMALTNILATIALVIDFKLWAKFDDNNPNQF